MKYDEFAAYNRNKKDYAAIYALKHAYQKRNVLRPLLAQFPAGNSISILEFGPGMGCLVDLLHEHYPDSVYHVVDIDDALLSKLKSRYPFLHTHLVEDMAALQALDLPQFDVVAALDVWEHLPPSQIVGYTKFSIDHLKTEGIFIAQVPNWGCPVTPHAVYAGDLTHTIPFNELSARQLLLMAGATEEHIELRGRMSPGVLGRIRDAIRTMLLYVFRLSFLLMGTVRLSILEPDLVILYRKVKSTVAH